MFQRKHLYIGCMALLTAACSKKDSAPPVPTGPVTQQEINTWILDSLHYFYLWNNTLPAQASATMSTIPFFNSVKNEADRFSFIYEQDGASSASGSMLYGYGMDFSIIPWPAAPGQVIGVVKLVIPGSIIAQAGLQRGDYFTRINGTLLTAGNAVQLGNELLEKESGSITPATIQNGIVTEGSVFKMDNRGEKENPVYSYTLVNNTAPKTGYLFYNAFNDRYSDQLLQAFRYFRQKGITELILDLRYNTGGSLATAAAMTMLIAPGISRNSPFVQYSGNNRIGQRTLDFATTLSVPEYGTPLSFDDVAANGLQLPRVFILSGKQTVSAAELLINNLKPYTQVIQIGETTFGKDMGAVIIYDMRSPKRISWIMYPITYRLSNARGQGNYSQGITPQYTIDEMQHQPLLPVGNTTDPLVAKALSIIRNNGKAAVETANPPVLRLYDAQEKHALQSRMVVPFR